jgi:hypothetical protein
MTKDTTAKAALSTLLVLSVAVNGWLFVKLQIAEGVILGLNRHLEQVAKDLTKEKTGVEATLAECNAALAQIQAKPVPTPVACPMTMTPPAPVCPAAPICPAAPAPTVCTCAPVYPCAEPAKIETPSPAVKEAHKHAHHHRRHHFHSLAAPKCEAPNDETF